MSRRRSTLSGRSGRRRPPALAATAALAGLGIILLAASARAQASPALDAVPPSSMSEAMRRALSATSPPAGEVSAAGVTTGALQEGPVDPATYQLGPGDELTVYFRGKTSVVQRLVVAPEGDLYLPDFGRVMLAGSSLEEGRRRIRAAAARIVRDVNVDVQLTRLRTFKVTVGGEVHRPGVYPATAVSRVFELLRLAGGLTDSAAVRAIRLQRDGGPGEVSIDLLPFLLQGRLGNHNPFISEGQSIFVPRRSRLVMVGGAVLHPGTYDLPSDTTTVAGMLDLVGLAADAVPERTEVLRVGQWVPAPGAAARQGSLAAPLDAGMRIFVPRAEAWSRFNAASIAGEVHYPGTYSLEPGRTSLRDLIERAGGFTAAALPDRVRLARPVAADSLARAVRALSPFPGVTLNATEKEVLRARGVESYRAVLVDLGESAEPGPALVPGDQILVPRNSGFIEVSGRVRQPGFYPHRAGASARDYVEAAGGFAGRADKGQIRVSGGAGDNFRLAKDAGSPEPGDQVWVPEKTPRSRWDTLRDTFVIAGQIATIVLVIDQLGK